MTPNEYLIWEEQQDLRYEYDDGLITAKNGSTLPHNDLVLNLLTLLRSHVKARGCQIYISEVKVQVRDPGPYYYPDLVVTCDPRDRAAIKRISHPSLIVEVLSPGTESADRGRKFRQFQKSETLKEYVLVDYESMSVECFRPGEGRFWVYEAFGEGEIVELTSIEFSCPIELIYEDVNLMPIESTESTAPDES
jgi:Uma2 family endonuclease